MADDLTDAELAGRLEDVADDLEGWGTPLMKHDAPFVREAARRLRPPEQREGDADRAREIIGHLPASRTAGVGPAQRESIAERIAAALALVRREERERCVDACHQHASDNGTAQAIEMTIRAGSKPSTGEG